MKVKELIKKHFKAIVEGKKKLQERLYRKITKKSLKHKKTQAVR
jgi:hypothetical protein